MKKSWLLIVLFFAVCSVYGQVYCPPHGSATKAGDKRINRLKNKGVNISDSVVAEILPLKNLLPSRRRKNDKDFWYEGAYIVTEGYLIDFDEQGPESCNCNRATVENKDGDVHMFLGMNKNALKKDALVIEITPKFKKREPAYENYLVKNSRIRVYGYLFYDIKHQKDAFTTCKTCTHIWRKTPWEVHPITRIEVLEEN